MSIEPNFELDNRTRYIAKLRNPLCDDIRITCLADNPQEVIDYARQLCWKVVAIHASNGFIADDVKWITIR